MKSSHEVVHFIVDHYIGIEYGSELPAILMTLPGYDSSIGGSGVISQRYPPEFKYGGMCISGVHLAVHSETFD